LLNKAAKRKHPLAFELAFKKKELKIFSSFCFAAQIICFKAILVPLKIL